VVKDADRDGVRAVVDQQFEVVDALPKGDLHRQADRR
jgi:hypothetical protein